ncbi:helix-turn-helix domain-containing protein, partial [Pantoea sp. SIMBA_079]
MPTPEKTSRTAIVAAGRVLIESGGLDGLTMQAVAERVGVRAPSLYKRVRDRREL